MIASLQPAAVKPSSANPGADGRAGTSARGLKPESHHAGASSSFKSARLTLGAAALLCAPLAWAAAGAQIACTADFSAMGQGQQAVAVNLRPDGQFDALVNGVRSNANGRVVDEQVRPRLPFDADPAGAEYATFNSAERSLANLHRVMALPISKDLIQLPFLLPSVRRIKTFDLQGKSDKFGGHVLLEAYDDRGVMLGRVVRRIFVAACR
jgi:hypothetical protein